MLASALHLAHYQIEQIQQSSPNDIPWQVYGVLRTWLAECSTKTTLGALKDALAKIGVEDIKLYDIGASNQTISLIPSTLDLVPIPYGGESFLLDMSEKLQCCWRHVGSLMGIPKSTLDKHALQNQQLNEQSYQMLLTWQRENGHEATYGAVFRAAQRMHEHNPDVVNDAWCYCVHYLEQSIPMANSTGSPTITTF